MLLAPSAVSGREILQSQCEWFEKAAGLDQELMDQMHKLRSEMYQLASGKRNDSARKMFNELVQQIPERYLTGMSSVHDPEESRRQWERSYDLLSSPWMQFFLQYDPSETLSRLQCPVLAVFGELDVQVSAETNVPALKSAFEKGRNEQVTVEVLPGLNHLFQEATTGHPLEYAVIEQTISPSVLSLIGEWIAAQTTLSE